MGLETINNKIHPTAIIGDNVTLGNNNYVGPFCYITSNTTIGDNNRFEAYCSIGTPAENK
jgi:acyl-[acyl carrier protein]--UDP-N-acetylglucosamine O-acyltransferase